MKLLLTKILGALISLSGKVAYLPRVDGSYRATAANTWQCTGTSFTVPANHIYLVRAQLGYSYKRPTGMGFYSGTSLPSSGIPTFFFADSSGVSISPCFMLLAGTYYLYEKRVEAPSGQENHYINIVDINYGS